MSEQIQLTKGQYRVGINFNPGGHEEVNSVKAYASEFIDYIESIASKSTNPEVRRLCAIAQTEVESAAMYAVKAATKPAV